MSVASGMACAAAAWLCIALAAAQAAPRVGQAECHAGAARSDVIEAIGLRGEIVLASGSRAVLGSLRWPDDLEVARATTDWLMARRGRLLTLVPRGETDRWGRSRIDATLDEEAVDLAGGIIRAGLAFADAGEGDALCRPALLAVEETARRAGLGLWRTPVLDARDGPALRAAQSRFAVIQGTIRHVGERATRTYLDFVGRGETGLSVSVSKRTWRRMLEHGLSADQLRGRLVRVRGVVEIRRSPMLDITVPEAVEVLDDPTATGGTDWERAPRR